MDDLLSQVSNQFEEDIKTEEPKKEEIKNEEIIKERFKVSEKYIEQRREMIELSKVESENGGEEFFKSKRKEKPKEREEKKEETRSSSSRGYGYGGYGYGSSSSTTTKKESVKNQERATEYADNVFDSLREKMENEFNADIPEDWDIFDIHNTANKRHKVAKETKVNGKLPMSIRFKLAALKTCVYVGHSTLETLYVLKNE